MGAKSSIMRGFKFNYHRIFICDYENSGGAVEPPGLTLAPPLAEALSVFKQFKSLVELKLGVPIKVVQSNWGGKFRSFSKFLADLGIVHRIICPHTHHQNGAVERQHRHIVDLGLTLLSQASLPLTYWDYAFSTAVFLINRLPSSAIKFQAPYTLLFHTLPDYKFLRVFGCVCFLLLRLYHAHKLEFRSQECLFLGYSISHKGYIDVSQLVVDFIFPRMFFSMNQGFLILKYSLSLVLMLLLPNSSPNLTCLLCFLMFLYLCPASDSSTLFRCCIPYFSHFI